MAYAYTVTFPNDGIIGVYSTMKKGEEAIANWIRDHGYNFTYDRITKKKNYQIIWFECGECAEIDRWFVK